jgi:hypothetical protein
VNFKQKDYGFEWGSIDVQRQCSDEEKGWVSLGVKSPKADVQIYATKTGKVRIYLDGVELTT